MLNSIARNFRISSIKFVGIDFNPTAIAHSQNYAKFHGLTSQFVLNDITILDKKDFPSSGNIFIMSNGVYHHLVDSLNQLQRTLGLLGSNAKLSFLFGFYHEPSREVIMNHFRNLKEKDYSVDQLRLEFNQLRGVSDDSLQDETWFQDQVNHPLEHSFKLEEINDIFAKFNFQIMKCSLDKFSSSEVGELLRIERGGHELAKKALRNRRFLPGYISALFVRN